MLDDMAMRAMRKRIQHDYVRHVRAFAAFLERSPHTETAEDVRRFQLHQCERGVGESTTARAWLAEREADPLPFGYFHVVFTLTAEVADIAFYNQALVCDLLFKAAS